MCVSSVHIEDCDYCDIVVRYCDRHAQDCCGYVLCVSSVYIEDCDYCDIVVRYCNRHAQDCCGYVLCVSSVCIEVCDYCDIVVRYSDWVMCFASFVGVICTGNVFCELYRCNTYW